VTRVAGFIVLIFVQGLTALPGRADGPSWALLSLALYGVKHLFRPSGPLEVKVAARGYGESEKEAVNKAILNAVSQAQGVYVVSDLLVDQDSLKKSESHSYTSGVIRSFRVVNCQQNEIWFCDIEALVVSKHAVLPPDIPAGMEFEKVNKIGLQRIDAQISLDRTSLIQKYQLTEFHLKRLRREGLLVQIKELQGYPSLSGLDTLDITYKISIDPKIKSEVVNFLRELERSTGGRNPTVSDREKTMLYPIRVKVFRGLFQRESLYINTLDDQYQQGFEALLTNDIEIFVKELKICERIPIQESIFSIDWSNLERTLRISRSSEVINDIRSLTFLPDRCPRNVESVVDLDDVSPVHQESSDRGVQTLSASSEISTAPEPSSSPERADDPIRFLVFSLIVALLLYLRSIVLTLLAIGLKVFLLLGLGAGFALLLFS